MNVFLMFEAALDPCLRISRKKLGSGFLSRASEGCVWAGELEANAKSAKTRRRISAVLMIENG